MRGRGDRGDSIRSALASVVSTVASVLGRQSVHDNPAAVWLDLSSRLAAAVQTLQSHCCSKAVAVD